LADVIVSQQTEIGSGMEMTMLTKAWRSLAMAAASFALAPTPNGHAAEIRLVAAAAMQSVFKEIGPEFERSSGHKLVIHYGTIGAINQWVLAGEEADFVIGSSQSMPALLLGGKVSAGSPAAICKTGIGIVAAGDSPVASVVSVEDFKRVLTDAKAIVYADPVRGGAAGIHVAKMIEKMGLTEQLKPKLRLAAGGDITEVTLALGQGAIGMTQISEIAEKKGAKLLGPFPDELQNYTVFVGAVPVAGKQSKAAKDFVKFLGEPAAVAVIKAKGMQVD
jgi:molybdate transport system substrate-binding protein